MTFFQHQLPRGKIKPVLTSVQKPPPRLFRVVVAFQAVLTEYDT